MPRGNVEVVREGVAAFNRRDTEAFIRVGHPDIEFRASGRLPGVPAVVHGPEAVRAWCDDLFSAFDVDLQPAQFTEAGDAVVATMKMSARGKGSGLSLENALTFVWHLQEGLVAEVDVYATRAEALEAVGLRE